MASKQLFLRMLFGGGWASDFGSTANMTPSASGDIVVPFLVDAENVIYELDGGPRKIGGTTKLNSSVVASGAEIMGIYDFWRMGTGGTGTQKRVLLAGTVIMADAADGTFANIATGKTDNAIPCFTTFNDKLIISTDATADAPQSYDGTTCAALGGTPPNFSFSVAHKNRVWAAGVAANPSTLYYSGNLDETDWSGATSGSISIDPNDGDRITGLASHKNELLVFKGPYRGSIHRITGSSPTGSDAFARQPFISGIGAVWHNTIFRYLDDLGFMWSDGTVRSLNSTANFGDYAEAALSRPIHKYIREHATFSRLNRCWAVNFPQRSIVVITLPIDAGQFGNQILMMDYSHNPVRWASWPAYNANCASILIDADASNTPKLMIGGRDGFVRKALVTNRSIDTTGAYTGKVTLPYTNLGSDFHMKTLAGAAVGISPKGPYNMTFAYRCDTNAQQTVTVSQSGGTALDTFTLDTDSLAGASFVNKFVEEVAGEFRQIQLQVSQGTTDQDLELHTLGMAVEVGGVSLEN